MKQRIKKFFNMKEQEAEEQTVEQTENQETAAENSSESTVNDTNSETVESLKQQLDEARNKFLYLYSDFETYKRHAAKERIDLITSAGREILTALLPILDDFERARKNSGLDEGMVLIHHKLTGILSSKGLAQFETASGDAFNADRHEAIAEIPAPTEELKGKILDVVEQGYMLGDRIIRFARVVVGQ
jgi:molecular chaperone GrpE